MAKSRVEKNKKLYDEIELESFELEDIGESSKKTPKKEQKKQEIVPVKKEKKNQLVEVPQVDTVKEEEFMAQPVSYTDKLSVEEILRAKLEKQQELKDSKKVYKKSPVTETYTAEMMQKNINQSEGVDIRKEANIKVKQETNNWPIIILVILLVVLVVAGAVVSYLLLKEN